MTGFAVRRSREARGDGLVTSEISWLQRGQALSQRITCDIVLVLQLAFQNPKHSWKGSQTQNTPAAHADGFKSLRFQISWLQTRKKYATDVHQCIFDPQSLNQRLSRVVAHRPFLGSGCGTSSNHVKHVSQPHGERYT